MGKRDCGGVKMKVVFSLGGSVVYNNGINIKFIKEFINYLTFANLKGAIVVGGGPIAREFIKAGREFNFSEYENDMLGIWETRKNATFILYAMKHLNVYPKLLYSSEEASIETNHYDWLIAGGFFPSITTDSVAALIAEAIKSNKLINISNVDKIYDNDPKYHKDAKPIERMKIDDFLKIAIESDQRNAGQNFIFDIVALKIAKRAKIEVHFVDANIEKIDSIIKGGLGGSVLIP